MPGHPISIKGNFFCGDSCSTESDTADLKFSLRSTGNIYNFDEKPSAEAIFDCPLAGPVFNPLAEKIYGILNPYADPSRGTIEPVTVVPADADESG